MHTVSVEIKIPDGHEVEEVSIVWPGYESSPDCAVGQMVVKTKAAKPLLINGVLSDWPEWLTCDWVAKDKNGRVYAYNGQRPTKESKRWHSYDGCWDITDILPIRIPGTFEQSLRENPRRKK